MVSWADDRFILDKLYDSARLAGHFGRLVLQKDDEELCAPEEPECPPPDPATAADDVTNPA